MAGHSKWANIKHRKARQDAKRGKIYTKLIRELTVAAKADGVSYFKNLAELNQKESQRLIWASKILNLLGIKNVTTKSSIKVNPRL